MQATGARSSTLRWILTSGFVALFASGCGEDHEYLLVSGAGDEVRRDGWIDRAEAVTGDGASSFVSQPGPSYNYSQPTPPFQIVGGVETRGLPRALLEGSRAYSLSARAGLVITDVSDPIAPRLVARHPIDGEPVGLVVRDGIAHVLVNDRSFLNSSPPPEYRCDDEGCEPTRSHLLSLDARQDPVRKLSAQTLRGTATNARRVGDALYVVTQSYEEPSYESPLEATALERRSALTSFDLADASGLAQVLELPFEGVAHRGFSFGAEQLYLVEHPWPPLDLAQRLTLRVFDLSTDGSVVAGPSAFLPAEVREGELWEDIEAAWNVVESGDAAYVFRAEDDLTPRYALSRTLRSALEPLPLPEPTDASGAPLERWKLAGARLFGLTADDTLVAYDLSAANAPERAGSLALPAVDGITISGDRVVAWGLETATSNLALIDAADLAQPRLLDVLNGPIGEWKLDPSTGLLVSADVQPGPGDRAGNGSSAEAVPCRVEEVRFMTVLDPRADDLSARASIEAGAAPLVAGDRFLAASDRYFTSAPRAGVSSPSVRIDLARRVDFVRALGDQIASSGLESFTGEPTLDIGSSRSALVSPGASTDAALMLGLPDNACEERRSWGDRVFELGTYAYVTRFHRTIDASGEVTGDVALTLHGIDRSDPAAPTAAASLTLPPLLHFEEYTAAVATDRALVLVRRKGHFRFGSSPYATFDIPRPPYGAPPGDEAAVQLYVEIVDLTDPAAPRLASSLELPRELAGGGWLDFVDEASLDTPWGWADGRRTGPLITRGSLVVSQHAELQPDGRLAYYLDRLDVSDPSAPVLLEPIRIPGRVLQLDARAESLVTLDTLAFEELATFETDCSRRGYRGVISLDLSKPKQTCKLVRRVLNGLRLEGDLAIRESQLVLDETRRAVLFAASGDQLFYVTEPPLAEDADPIASEDTSVSLERIRVRDGRFERLPSLDLRGQHRLLPRRWQTALARGERFYSVSEGELGVVDFGVDPPALASYTLPAGGCPSLEVAGDTAHCALGPGGFASIDLQVR